MPKEPKKEIDEIQKIAESLSEIERKIIPYLEERDIKKLEKLSELDRVSIVRALNFLKNKGLIKLEIGRQKIIELGVNGVLYKKKGLPERKFLNILEEIRKTLSIEEIKKQSKLSNNEFTAALGALKNKALIELKDKKISLKTSKEELMEKTFEEKLIETLPRPLDKLAPEELQALENLKKRKNIIEIKDQQKISYSLTELGIEVSKISEKISEKLIEQITPNLIKNQEYKGKKFRRYDIISPVSKIYGGKRHFTNQAIDHARKIWTDMGFKEMTGSLIQSSFWNFDALFTAQDHPVREMQDTFFIDKQTELPDKKIVTAVKKAHENGVDGSKGWRYKWQEQEAKKLVLRTHTTCLSAQTIAKLNQKDLPAKFFAIGTNFRNETVDWNHGFELLQSEGIVIDENANFRHLLGYLKQFAKKMGFEKIRFRPAYFPYTEPSLEGDVWDEEKKQWIELIAAGIFRPEVTEPLFGKPIPVLAWGPGFGRMLMAVFNIKDIRELNKNDIEQLRKIKFLVE